MSNIEIKYDLRNFGTKTLEYLKLWEDKLKILGSLKLLKKENFAARALCMRCAYVQPNWN